MRLSDIMSAARLEVFAEVALLIFFACFVVVAAHALFSRSAKFERARHLPLEDFEPLEPRDAAAPAARPTPTNQRNQQ